MRINLLKLIKSLVIMAFVIPTLCLAETNTSKDTPVSDTWLQAKLVTTYALNNNLSIFDIDVDVRDQIAYLKGVVDTPIKKDLAGEIAKSVEGVKSVENSITVDDAKAAAKRANMAKNSTRSFGQVIEDLTTTASIKSKLFVDRNVSAMDINVDTENNRVTLTGKVRTETERELIEKMASNTSGVKDVSNKIEVKS